MTKFIVILVSILFCAGCDTGLVCSASKEAEIRDFVLDCSKRSTLDTCTWNAKGLYSCEYVEEIPKNVRRWTNVNLGTSIYFQDVEKGD